MPEQAVETPVGVLIVDDHDGYRAVASEVVHATPGFWLVGLAADRLQALEWMRRYRDQVDLVLMDVNLGIDDGMRLTEEIVRQVNPPDIVLVTTLACEDLPRNVRSCGARGYLPKAELSPSALQQVRAGVYDWPRV